MNEKDENIQTDSRSCVSFEEYMAMQVQKIRSPFNEWVTGEKVGRKPTDDELAMNYIQNGGAADHEKEYGSRLKP